jgi:hypothetical protein
MPGASYRRLYRGQAWRRTARLVLLRDGARCQVTPGCPNRAGQAHHIVSAHELWLLGWCPLCSST